MGTTSSSVWAWLMAVSYTHLRAVVCSEPYSALLSMQHNDTNILAFGARFVGLDLALMIVDTWLSGVYEGGRHARRVQMISDIEERQKNK